MITDRIKGLARLPGSRLRAADENFRTHDARQRKVLRGLLAEIGIVGAVLVWVPDDMARAALRSSKDFGKWLSSYDGPFQLIDGHMRAEEIKGQSIPVLVTDLSRAEAAKALATFDAAGDLAGRDAEKLAALLADVGRGSEEGTEALLASLRSGSAADDNPTPVGSLDDEIPDGIEPRTKKGDVWTLGKHRLICGDCRAWDDIDRLVCGDMAALAFTSPPYASQRKYDESSGFKPIHPDEFVDWFADVQSNVARIIADDGSWFVNIKEHCEDGQRSLYVKDLAVAHVRSWGWRFIDELIWRRTGIPGENGNVRFRNDYEPIFHFAKRVGRNSIKFNPTAVGHESDSIRVYASTNKKKNSQGNAHVEGEMRSGIARPGNVLDVAVNRENLGHSAMFPVALPEFFILAYSDPGDVVFEPFMGSGSTMIAAERRGRVCYGVELSPAYCDIAVTRWERLTGKTATVGGA